MLENLVGKKVWLNVTSIEDVDDESHLPVVERDTVTLLEVHPAGVWIGEGGWVKEPTFFPWHRVAELGLISTQD